MRQLDPARQRPVIIYERKRLDTEERYSRAAHLLEHGYVRAAGSVDTLARPSEMAGGY